MDAPECWQMFSLKQAFEDIWKERSVVIEVDTLL